MMLDAGEFVDDLDEFVGGVVLDEVVGALDDPVSLIDGPWHPSSELLVRARLERDLVG